jgi:hypothetical protein
MTTLSEFRLAELREIAEKATQQAWRIDGWHASMTGSGWYIRAGDQIIAEVYFLDGEKPQTKRLGHGNADAHHIAAFDPATAKQLVDLALERSLLAATIRARAEALREQSNRWFARAKTEEEPFREQSKHDGASCLAQADSLSVLAYDIESETFFAKNNGSTD